jgi:hypothetical protein
MQFPSPRFSKHTCDIVQITIDIMRYAEQFWQELNDKKASMQRRCTVSSTVQGEMLYQLLH